MDNTELDAADQPASEPEIIETDDTDQLGEPGISTAAKKRRRGSRGGKNRKKPNRAAGARDDNGSTRGLMVQNEIPGGNANAFCDDVSAISMPHSSVSSSMPRKPLTVSTSTRVSSLCWRTT